MVYSSYGPLQKLTESNVRTKRNSLQLPQPPGGKHLPGVQSTPCCRKFLSWLSSILAETMLRLCACNGIPVWHERQQRILCQCSDCYRHSCLQGMPGQCTVCVQARCVVNRVLTHWFELKLNCIFRTQEWQCMCAVPQQGMCWEALLAHSLSVTAIC